MIGRWLPVRWRLPRWGRTATGLGAAVTALPTGPLRWAPAPVAAQVAAQVAAPEPAPPPPLRVGPQVVLGFRDGSEAVLDPESAQARALEGIALTLAARD